MLYCPKCGAEYREGYSSCSDCHVLLVRERPQTLGQVAPTPGDPNEDPYCRFWQGTDDRGLGELTAVLDEAGIPFNTIRSEDRLFNRTDLPKLLLGVPVSLYEKAEQVVVAAFSGQPVFRDTDGFISPALQKSFDFDDDEPAMELEESLTTGSPDSPRSSALLEDWFPEDASVEVWRGNSCDSWMIEMSLKENEIRFRAETAGDQRQLFVLADNEKRAREIIREILESTPPE